MEENQMMQNGSNVFRRVKVYHEHSGLARRIPEHALTLHLNWLPRLVLLPPSLGSYGGQARSSGFRDRRAPDYTTRPAVALCSMARQANGSPSRSFSEGWSLGKVLPLRLLGVGQP